MKKLLMVLAVVSVSFSAMAQDDPTLKYSVATNSFWSNWFVQLGANWNAWYSSEEHGFGFDRSPVRISVQTQVLPSLSVNGLHQASDSVQNFRVFGVKW